MNLFNPKKQTVKKGDLSSLMFINSLILQSKRVLSQRHELDRLTSLLEVSKKIILFNSSREPSDEAQAFYDTHQQTGKDCSALKKWTQKSKVEFRRRRHISFQCRKERIKKIIFPRTHRLSNPRDLEMDAKTESTCSDEEWHTKWLFWKQKDYAYRQEILACRQSLIRELLNIFRVKLGEALPSICGFSIFSLNEYVRRATKQKSKEFWILGTSLGFLAHFLIILAKYLNTPLNKKIIPFSSMTRLMKNDETAHLNQFHCKTRIPPLTVDVECPRSCSDSRHEDIICNDDTLHLNSFSVGSQTLSDLDNPELNKISPLSEILPSDFMVCVRLHSFREDSASTPHLIRTSSMKFNSLWQNEKSLNMKLDNTLQDEGVEKNPLTTSDTLGFNINFLSMTQKFQSPSKESSQKNSGPEHYPLYIKSSSEADRSLFIQGLAIFQSVVHQFMIAYEYINNCKLFKTEESEKMFGNLLEKNQDYKYTTVLEDTDSNMSLFEPLRRVLIFELKYKKHS